MITLLTGSGTSSALGLEGTEKITKKLFCAEDIVFAKDDKFHCVKEKDFEKEYSEPRITLIQKTINVLSTYISAYYQQPQFKYYYTKHIKIPNYEDIYYLVEQIYDANGGEYDNPSLLSFISELNEKIELPKEFGWKLNRVCEEIQNYVRTVAVCSLSNKPEPLQFEKFIFFEEIFKEHKFINLFTLNHDLIWEHYLEHLKKDYYDGFVDNKWNGFECVESEETIRLIKLHGSLNWSKNGNSYFSVVEKNNLSISEDPFLLIGTFNKILSYTDNIFLEMYYKFYKVMESSDELVVCGYGFGDKGINKQIERFSALHSQKKILVIDPDKNLKNKVRPAVRKLWDNAKINQISEIIENVKLDEIKMNFSTK